MASERSDELKGRDPSRLRTDEERLALKYRERIHPARGDKAYALLADLRDALADVLDGAVGDWLDFGAGTAPYRELLGKAWWFWSVGVRHPGDHHISWRAA